MKQHLCWWGAVVAFLAAMLTPPSHSEAQDFLRPRGIYLLGAGRDTTPDPVAMAKPFVDGYTLRLFWEDVEPVRDGYDFSAIDETLANLEPFGPAKRLTLELLARSAPDWILAEPGVVTYEAQDIAGVGPSSETVTLPVPWDEFTLTRWEALMGAMADHEVYDSATGSMVSLASHSRLAQVDANIPGLGGIRDLGNKLVTSPVYSRTAFLGAINRAVNATEDRFPESFIFLMFFGMNDGQNPPLNGEILEGLRGEFFPGTGQPRLGLFKENLSCASPAGLPSDALFTEQDRTFIMFQALQGWTAPFANSAATDACLVFDPPLPEGWQTGDPPTDNAVRRTAVSGPEVGMLLGINTFKARYFEMYIQDLQQDSFDDDFQMIHDIIWATEASAGLEGWVVY
jgi:hypothetical protein